MKNNTIKYGIKLIFIANLINLIFNLLCNFLLPKYLSVNVYADVKTFLMYVSYVGVLHLGYSDGMFLKYGGTDLNSITNKDIECDIKTMKIFQIIISIIASVFSFIYGDKIIIASAIVIFPINMANYYRYLFQATGEFKVYSRLMNITSILTSAILIFLLILGFRTQTYIYLLAYIIIDYLIYVYIEYAVYKKYKINSQKFMYIEI